MGDNDKVAVMEREHDDDQDQQERSRESAEMIANMLLNRYIKERDSEA